MYCHNELAQKIESFILQNKTMRRKLDNHIVYTPSILIIKEPRILQIPTKKASSNPPITLEKKHRPYELEEISSEIKKVKLTKDDGAVNLYNVIFFSPHSNFIFSIVLNSCHFIFNKQVVSLKGTNSSEEEKANNSKVMNCSDESEKTEKKIENNTKKLRKIEEELVTDTPPDRKKERLNYIYSYKENDRKKLIEITDYDLRTLDADKFLNDTIINFFLK